MVRLARNVLPEYGVFHVTARGVDRCLIYRDDADYAFFVNLLRRVRQREALRVEAYCLMPNHFHAIVEAELERLSRAMHRLNGLHARRSTLVTGVSGTCSRGATTRSSWRMKNTSGTPASTSGTTPSAPASAPRYTTGPGAAGC